MPRNQPMLCSRSKILAAGAILCLLIGQSLPANAQWTSIPDNMFQLHPDKRMIASQLRLSAKTGRKALAGLEASPRDSSVPLDDDVIRTARETYGLIRVARAGLQTFIGNQKFPDPVDQ